MLIYLFLLLFIAVVFGGAYYAYRIAFYSPDAGRDSLPVMVSSAYDPYREEMRKLFRQLQDRPFEFVTAESHDGLLLSGRYYHVADGAPLDICFHGYRSSPLTDFSGGSSLSQELGHNLLLVDQRAHGKSQGRTITFGIKERRDVLQWVRYAVERFGEDVQILLYGISMGGATVLMASDLELPKNVKGIIADCPYASPMDIILHVGKGNPIPNWLIRPLVRLGAWVYGGFVLDETDAIRSVEQAKVPILILHGEADTFVPPEMSDIVSVNPQLVSRHTVANANHGLSFLENTPQYCRIVKDFVYRVLN